MSVLIKGMNVPKSCFNCPFRENVKLVVDYCRATGLVLSNDFSVLVEGRHEACPLVPVPKHGRLIDADALKLSHCVECTLYPNECLGDECDWDSIYHLEHAPTIIEAEEGE